MQFRKGIVLATWLHVAGRCSFLLCQTVAIYISLRDVLRVFNFSPTLFKVQKVNRMKYMACTIMHKAQHEIQESYFKLLNFMLRQESKSIICFIE